MAEIDSQLNVIEETINNQLNETEQDKLRRKIRDAADNLSIARANEKDAPLNRQRAEMEYSMLLNPNNPNDVLRGYYKTEANTIKEDLLKRAREKISHAVDSTNYLNSQKKFMSTLPVKEGFTDSETENINTLYRKSELYSTHDNVIMIWINIMNCIILAYAFVMIYDLRSNLLDPMVGITIALTFASVFILDKMIYVVYAIPSHIIKYLGWGSDSLHSSAWVYLYVPIVAIILYIIIYNLIV
jgi:hypothetical protein